MLDSAVVGRGWISEAEFLTGIALVQAMPGPLFNIAAYVGELCRGHIYCYYYYILITLVPVYAFSPTHGNLMMFYLHLLMYPCLFDLILVFLNWKSCMLFSTPIYCKSFIRICY